MRRWIEQAKHELDRIAMEQQAQAMEAQMQAEMQAQSQGPAQAALSSQAMAIRPSARGAA